MITAEQIVQGKAIAEAVGLAMYQRIGERDACGFGWVEVYVDRTNSKQLHSSSLHPNHRDSNTRD